VAILLTLTERRTIQQFEGSGSQICFDHVDDSWAHARSRRRDVLRHDAQERFGAGIAGNTRPCPATRASTAAMTAAIAATDCRSTFADADVEQHLG
jgi:hypothetical protein